MPGPAKLDGVKVAVRPKGAFVDSVAVPAKLKPVSEITDDCEDPCGIVRPEGFGERLNKYWL